MRETRSQRFTSGGATLTYDPLGRLYQVSSPSGVRRFQYASDDSGTPEVISEYNGSNQGTESYGYGPGPNEPMLWWDGAASFAQRNLQADERGSIVAVTDTSGNPVTINRYDEYGIPASTNGGPFGYTGQLWLPEVGLYYYKARFYSPTLGRFLQTDPIGQGDNPNLYAYVHNNPVNMTDPLGLAGGPCVPWAGGIAVGDIVINQCRPQNGSRTPGTTRDRSSERPEHGAPDNQDNDKDQKCSAAKAALDQIGRDLATEGSDINIAGVGAVGLSGLAALFAPEAAPAEIEGAELGVGFIEVGGAAEVLGKTLSGFARGGVLGAARNGGSAFIIDRLSGAAANRFFRNASEAARLAQASVLSQLIDKAKNALINEQKACSGQ